MVTQPANAIYLGIRDYRVSTSPTCGRGVLHICLCMVMLLNLILSTEIISNLSLQRLDPLSNLRGRIQEVVDRFKQFTEQAMSRFNKSIRKQTSLGQYLQIIHGWGHRDQQLLGLLEEVFFAYTSGTLLGTQKEIDHWEHHKLLDDNDFENDEDLNDEQNSEKCSN